MKFFSPAIFFALVLSSNFVFAEQNSLAQPPVKSQSALQLIEQLQSSFVSRNYELSFIKTRQGAIEPMRYIHGLVDDVEVAHLLNLNGPAQESVYRDLRVAYFEQGQPPYSVEASRLSSLFSSIAKIDLDQLQHSYELVIAGKSRVAGRASQVIRVLPKNKDRYAVFLWIDYQTSLPIRIDLVDSNGELIEQYMAVTLIDFSSPTEWMYELASIELPAVISSKTKIEDQFATDLDWELTWMPEGMVILTDPGQRISSVEDSVDHQRMSDGLFDISVYVNKLDDKARIKPQLVRQGATTLHIQLIQGREVTVVGEVPPETASKIANSIRFSTSSKRVKSGS
ncbi:transcriptional regulator [Alginatibacterium sediminis]|uniref:Transcriptional regulator n=1 Tax=Alginatibacterium sediminis TaxID=2164068 RepID=A0A420ED96_9ALTE|nr:MucB/RseB C-terminal domain-containing protein [Alginatibacterium sediminis]RKF18602.1 transcriptional regulator [Alginatibacterium sediminis]